jgi:hypothetical protein
MTVGAWSTSTAMESTILLVRISWWGNRCLVDSQASNFELNKIFRQGLEKGWVLRALSGRAVLQHVGPDD